MNSNTFTLLETFCRTCMNGEDENDKDAEGKTRKAISIFKQLESIECNNITIMELLMITTPQLSIDSSDMLPKTLCESCLERLINAYKFQKMCLRVEQKLREMIKENTIESPQNKDPLKEISIDNLAVSQAISDLSNILKIEMDEPLIDQNDTSFSNKSVIEDVEDVKFEANDNNWQDVSYSCESDDVDSDSEWETPLCNTKSKKAQKIVKKAKEESGLPSKKHKSSKNNTVNEKDQTSDISSDSNKNSKIPTGAKNGGSKNFECDECGNRLSTRKSLKRHKRIHLRTLEVGQKNTLVKTKYECEFCKKVFQQSSSLKDHLRTHTGEQPYLCSECGKAFKSLSNMKQHFLRHGTDRPYVCPDCPKRFPCLSDLASHKAVHNKTKSHVCDICGAAFVKPYLLKKHKMYHTGEKNHKCDYCDMRFVLADQCRRHMRTHTGEKPYKCKYCERAFAQSNDLIKHLRGHLGDNVYKCDLCPQGFRLQGDLRAHFNTHKNDDDETKARNLQSLRDEEHRLQMKFGLIKCT